MIEVTGKVTHDGKTYEVGEVIENIKTIEAQRLVDLGVAFFVDKNRTIPPEQAPSDSKEPIDLSKIQDELETIHYDDLKDISKELGLEFPGNISKANLITLIIESDKGNEVLSLTEVEE